MRLHTRLIFAGTMLAVIATAAIAMSASAAPPLKITNCTKASARPKSVTLTCGDGNTLLSKLTWSSFGGSKAAAKGTFETNTCEPNCAAGKVVKYPVTASAYEPRNCKGGIRVYNKLTLVFPGSKPKNVNQLKRWTVGCPI
jgi:hypothetical protein